MFTLAYESRFKILLVHFAGVFSSEDITAVDAATLALVARRGPVHAILDFDAIEAVAVPLSKLIQRAQQPWASPGTQHIIVASRPEFQKLAHAFAEQQRLSGLTPTLLVSTLGDALGELKAANPHFEPVEGT